MRLTLLAFALTACGASNPNQANYDKIQAESSHADAAHADAAHADDGHAKEADAAPADKADHADATADAGHAEPEAPAADAVAAAGPQGDADKGAEVFKTYCVACHGADGKGMNGLAANFVDDKTRLAKPDAELVKSVREGYTGQIGTMPPWGAVVDEAAAYNAIAYLRREYGTK